MKGTICPEGHVPQGTSGTPLKGVCPSVPTCDPQPELRKLWRAHFLSPDSAVDRGLVDSEGRQRGIPSIPRALFELTCGARTRAGTACKRKDLYSSGRCRLHGGLSTGPRSREGHQKACANLRKRWNPMKC